MVGEILDPCYQTSFSLLLLSVTCFPETYLKVSIRSKHTHLSKYLLLHKIVAVWAMSVKWNSLVLAWPQLHQDKVSNQTPATSSFQLNVRIATKWVVIICLNLLNSPVSHKGWLNRGKAGHLNSGLISNNWTPLLTLHLACFASQPWIGSDHIIHIAKKEMISKYLDLQSQQWQIKSLLRWHLSCSDSSAFFFPALGLFWLH